MLKSIAINAIAKGKGREDLKEFKGDGTRQII
jgi:hypothetical protein